MSSSWLYATTSGCVKPWSVAFFIIWDLFIWIIKDKRRLVTIFIRLFLRQVFTLSHHTRRRIKKMSNHEYRFQLNLNCHKLFTIQRNRVMFHEYPIPSMIKPHLRIDAGKTSLNIILKVVARFSSIFTDSMCRLSYFIPYKKLGLKRTKKRMDIPHPFYPTNINIL